MLRMKKTKPLYDENGRWINEFERIKAVVRVVFRQSPQHKQCMENARVELPPKLKNDGTPGKRNTIRYKCTLCNELFPSKYVNVDHIEEIIPLHVPRDDIDYNTLVRSIFCDIKNLQILCSIPMIHNDNNKSCHLKKTNEEKFIRKRFKEYLADNEANLTKGHINLLTKQFTQEYEVKLEEALCKQKNKKKKS